MVDVNDSRSLTLRRTFPFRPWVRRAGFSIVLVALAVTIAIVSALAFRPDWRYGWIGERFVWVYVGTLWEVEATAARTFVEVFYDAFLGGEQNLGECLRRAKSTIKDNRNRTDWLAFILYGDPHVLPSELFPSLGKAAASSQESEVSGQESGDAQ